MLKKSIKLFLLHFSIIYFSTNLFFYYMPLFTSENNGTAEMVSDYRIHSQKYNVIYLGDSRTECAMDTEFLDKLLGTASYNMSGAGHWFPTQYPHDQDIVPYMSPNTTVVWSINYENFQPFLKKIKLIYPIGYVNCFKYLSWGYSFYSIRTNMYFYGLSPFLNTYLKRGEIHREIFNFFQEPFNEDFQETGHKRETPLINQDKYDRLKDKYKNNPFIKKIIMNKHNDTIVCASIYKKRGNVTNFEFEPEYFRKKQRELASKIKPVSPEEKFKPHEGFWKTFVAIIDLFEKHKVNLVINEFENAPYNYSIPENGKYLRSFMNDVRAYVEQRGFPYIRVDFHQLKNDDYFDRCHLNSKGIKIFLPMFVEKLKPYLKT